MSSFGFYGLTPVYGTSSQLLDCTCSNTTTHYYSDERFHFRQWLHLPSKISSAPVPESPVEEQPSKTVRLFRNRRRSSQ